MSLERKPRTQVGSRKAPVQRHCISIAGLTLGLSSVEPNLLIGVDSEMTRFQIADRECDIEVTTGWAESIAPSKAPVLFESGSLWRLVQEDGRKKRFEFATPALGVEPYKIATADEDFTRVHVELNRMYFTHETTQLPLEYPLDELLYVHRLARDGEGVEVHACGLIAPDGTGHLFAGHSGAGKSTTSRLWTAMGARILSDDRIILRMENGRMTMHGTPWHGDANEASQGSAPLHGIYLLEQSSRNHAKRMTTSEAAVELFARSFLPFHGHTGIASVLGFYDHALDTVACHRLEFLPELSAVEHVMQMRTSMR